MFLNGLRVKSIYRKVYKATQATTRKPLKHKIKTIAIIQNSDCKFSKLDVKDLAKIFGIQEENIAFMTLKDISFKNDNNESNEYYENQIGWNATLKTKVLRKFCKEPYDLLINYYNKDLYPLVALTVLSQAKFKIGLSEDFTGLNDLTVKIALGDTRRLIQEISKYMRILNLIA